MVLSNAIFVTVGRGKSTAFLTIPRRFKVRFVCFFERYSTFQGEYLEDLGWIKVRSFLKLENLLPTIDSIKLLERPLGAQPNMLLAIYIKRLIVTLGSTFLL